MLRKFTFSAGFLLTIVIALLGQQTLRAQAAGPTTKGPQSDPQVCVDEDVPNGFTYGDSRHSDTRCSPK
jgi:hypothetical protein